MAKNPKILSIVLAGGEGTRLMPLTRDRAKPAVPFGGVFRLIDFPLSNLVNSGYMQTVVLTQYKSHSLDRHISTVWRFSPLLGNYVSPVPAQQRLGKHWYLGSADAIYQTINIIEDVQPDIVVIVGADHVYRMDFQQMVQQHIESGAEFTVAGIRQPISQSNQFGVIEVDPEHPNMIKSFQEKPQTTTGLPDDPNSILASMGNYVANTDALFEALALDEKAEDTKHDMGGDIAPYFAARNEAGVYDFNSNEIPGATADRSRLLARRRYAEAVLRCAHGSDRVCAGVQPVQHRIGRFTRCPATCRRRSSCTPAATVWATPPTRSSPPA